MQPCPASVDTIWCPDIVLSNVDNAPHWALEEILQAGTQKAIEESALAQPIKTVLQIALDNLMIFWISKPARGQAIIWQNRFCVCISPYLFGKVLIIAFLC